jgi:hypothetical protein
MARIDIEIEDYLDEVATKYLVKELEKRHDLKDYKIDLYSIETPEFKNGTQLLSYIKKLLGLREFHDMERVISEIKLLQIY